jgi:hypothetical protein
VTIHWTSESGTVSSAAIAWISACSTITATYPGRPSAGRRLAVSMVTVLVAVAADKLASSSATGGVPGAVEGGATDFASAG